MLRRKQKKRRTPLYTIFLLAGMSICNHLAQARPIDHSADLATAANATETAAQFVRPRLSMEPNAENIIRFIMYRFEGPGFVANDNGHGASHWGILGEANGLSYAQVLNLTPDKAAQIYKKNYWDAINADNLPPDMRLVAFNAAVQFGPQQALKMIRAAQGDPSALLRATSDFCHRLAIENPSVYQSSLKNWTFRAQILSQCINDPLTQSKYLALSDMGRDPPQWHNQTRNVFTQKSLATPVTATDPIQEIKMSPSALSGAFDFCITLIRFPLQLILGVGVPLISLLFGTSWEDRKRRVLPERTYIKKRKQTLPWAPKEELIQRKVCSHSSLASHDYSTFNATECAAFHGIYGRRRITTLAEKKSWRVQYDDTSHLVVKKDNISVHGEKGIEDSLKYIAKAWNNRCKVFDGTAQTLSTISAVAQRLVDQGVLAPGFTIEGVGAYYPRFARPMESFFTPHYSQAIIA